MKDFTGLLEEIRPKLKGITHRLSARRTILSEDDLFQEALLNLWVDYSSGGLENKTSSYILQGCYFHLKNYIRKAKVNRNFASIDEIIDDDGNTLRDILPQPAVSFRDYLNDKLLAQTILNNGLTGREKELLPFIAQGFTCRQIGEKIGVSHVTIVKMTASIRRKCAKHLDKI